MTIIALKYITVDNPEYWIEYRKLNGMIEYRNSINPQWDLTHLSPSFKTLDEIKELYKLCPNLYTLVFEIFEGDNKTVNEKHRCNCDFTNLLRYGCACGGI